MIQQQEKEWTKMASVGEFKIKTTDQEKHKDSSNIKTWGALLHLAKQHHMEKEPDNNS